MGAVSKVKTASFFYVFSLFFLLFFTSISLIFSIFA